MTDPRLDLVYDSDEWAVLLSMAEDTDKDCAWLLHGLRCGGMRLHRGPSGYALRPEYDPATSAWVTPEEYAKDRDKWLMPQADMIVRLLDRLTKVMEKAAS